MSFENSPLTACIAGLLATRVADNTPKIRVAAPPALPDGTANLAWRFIDAHHSKFEDNSYIAWKETDLPRLREGMHWVARNRKFRPMNLLSRGYRIEVKHHRTGRRRVGLPAQHAAEPEPAPMLQSTSSTFFDCQSIPDVDSGDVCAICLDAHQDPETLRCGHMFCRVCLDQYRRSQLDLVVCPLCRGPNFDDEYLEVVMESTGLHETYRSHLSAPMARWYYSAYRPKKMPLERMLGGPEDPTNPVVGMWRGHGTMQAFNDLTECEKRTIGEFMLVISPYT